MMSMLPLILIAPLLVAAAYSDLRHLRIPNAISVTIVSVFVAANILDPVDDLGVRLLTAGCVFSLGFIGFGLRLIGGGDVKLLSALVLLVPANGLILFANTFSAALLIGVATIVLLRRSRLAGYPGWKSFSGKRTFPMGISIALTGLVFPALLSVN